ncbi:ABC transporter permease subunit [Methylobacterium sp. WL64]|uniref:ABC transporter permease subunit n=1 Tax=Methylobacterium sp. WL64 TaxID=2603894 RepID=UPI00164F998B|nr:ABC transporter permease subunit [Methylobacterium sp. WL64]
MGLVNTLKVAIVAIVLSTIVGTLVGVGRLSTNWLVRQLSFGLVEVVRNTPLLIQIVFWYFAVVLQFPPASTAANMFGLVIASQSGVFLPFVAVSETTTGVASAALAAGIAALLVVLSGGLFDTGRIVKRGALALAAVLLAVSIVAGFPLIPNLPVVTRFGARGGCLSRRN